MIKNKVLAMILGATMTVSAPQTTIPIQTASENAIVSENSLPTQETYLSPDEFQLLANLVMAESENQDWDAQYGVACVVLKRVKSNLFPNTVTEVIYHSDDGVIQFTSMYNGRYERVIELGGANDSCMEAVQSACEINDFPDDVLYFTSNGYLKHTIPYEKIDKMYFSAQKVLTE